MTRPTVLLAALLLAACSTTSPQQTSATAAPDPRIDRFASALSPTTRVEGRQTVTKSLEQRMREENIPALSLAVIEDGRIAWAHAWGLADVASGRPATPRTLFQAASISKPVAATAALDLAEAGVIALDKPVNAQLESWKIPQNAWSDTRPVTPRDLLTHSAGLTVHGFPGYAVDAARPSVVQILNGEPPANTKPVVVDIEPGKTMRYSGGGLTVLQLLMSDAAGRPFEAVVEERVLRPIGMRDSTFAQPLPASRAGDAATAYDAKGTPVPGRFHVYPEQAAAGLWTTPTDLAKWILDIQASLRGEAGHVLDPATARAFVTPHAAGGYGLGVGVQGSGETLRFTHSGSNEGFRARFVAWVDGGDGYVLMTNSDSGAAIANEVALTLAKEHGWNAHEQRVIVPVSMSPEQLQPFTGTYVFTSSRVELTLREDGTLWSTMPSGGTLELIPVGVDRFQSPGLSTELNFERDASGNIVGFRSGQSRATRVPPAK